MKKVIVIVLAVLLVLLPSIALLVLHLIPESVIQTPINISGTFTDGKIVNYKFNRSSNSDLALFFDSLDENASPAQISLDQIAFDKSFSAEFVKRNQTTKLKLYLSLDGDCYYSDGNGALYLINHEYADSILNSEYAISMYEERYTHSLLTFSNDNVIPSSVDFEYTVKNHDSVPAANLKTTKDVLTYYSSNTSSFKFSTEPDTCYIKAFVGDEMLYDGYLFKFDPSLLPSGALVRFEIEATWITNKTNQCYGTANYNFFVDYSPAPIFKVAQNSATAGDLLIIKADNIRDFSKLNCTFAGNEITDLRFFEQNGTNYALLPIDVNTEAGSKELVLSCGETTLTSKINIQACNRTSSFTQYTAEAPLTSQMIDEMNKLIASVGLECKENIEFSDSFLDYTKHYSSNDMVWMLGFGRVREFTNGDPFNMIGVEYVTYSDMTVPAINNGVVCAIGENSVLGKYIIVDHGFGLKSWYCNISEALLSVGTVVNKGDDIAKTGKTAFYGHQGVYLITTVLDTPVSPDALFEKNFVLP